MTPTKILEASRADGATIETYKGVSIIVRAARGSLGFPDSTLAIVGSVADVRAAIDRKTAPSAIRSALAVEVNRWSTTEDAWFVSMAPISQFQPQAPGADAGPMAVLSKVQQASGGVKFGANVVVSLQAVSPTDQDAAALAAVLNSFASASDVFLKDVYVGASSLLKNLSATAEGQVTTISLSVPESQIEEMIKASHANEPHQAIGVDPRALPPVRAAEPPPSKGGTPQRIRVGSEVQERKRLQHPEPVYPPLAMQARISGVVRLNAIIGRDGTVQNLTVVSGHPLLVPAAMEAVKQWVYEPTLLNGQAVEVVAPIAVEFSLSQ